MSEDVPAYGPAVLQDTNSAGMLAQPSPGPWRVSGVFVVTSVPTKRDPGVREVLIVADCGYERFTPRDQHEANARLIAAAPDLLAACRAALEVVAESWADETDLVWHRLRAQLEAAVLKTAREAK